MRAPFAYPLLRGVDAESGGAADLQTDIMRFMAILALCLMAVFALVQSLPPVPTAAADPEPPAPAVPVAAAAPVDLPEPAPPDPAPVLQTPPEPPVTAEAPVVLTRPKPRPPVRAAAKPPPPATDVPTPSSAPATPEPERGFTLRFESDLALSRLVAQGDVGFFALDETGARRMSVQNSRLSFWAAPTPRRYHEMDGATVPKAVRDALRRTGRAARDTAWAVTLPPRLSRELERLMREHDGGALIIRRDGSLERQSS